MIELEAFGNPFFAMQYSLEEFTMKILFVTSECAPFSKSGGLADVAYSLPPALKDAGDEIAIITPLYQCVKERYLDELKDIVANATEI